MFEKIKQKICLYFNNGHSRSKLAKQNIVKNAVYKIGSIAVSFLLVPITINYVNSDVYGLWLTLSSVVGWLSFFDIGINNGLRNKLTQAIAQNDFIKAREYVSTTYIILTLIFSAVFLFGLLLSKFIDWNSFFNVYLISSEELSLAIIVLLGFICLRFILSTINIVLFANQDPSGVAARGLLEQLLVVLTIYLLTLTTKGSLINLALGLSIMPLLILVLFSYLLYAGKYSQLSPSLKYVKFHLGRDLFSVGFRFFIIQLAGIVQFQTANFLILKYYSPADVTNYNISYKYFSVLSFLMGILLAPFWSAVTDAYYKKDFDWIISAVNKYLKVSVFLIFIGAAMFLFSNWFYSFWIGKEVPVIPISLSFVVYLYFCISLVGSVYTGVLNGISALKIQYLACLVSPLIFLISCYFLIGIFKLPVYSVVISTILANFNSFLLAPYQYRQIFLKNGYNSYWSR